MAHGLQLSTATNAHAYKDALLEWMAKFGVGARQALRWQGRLMGERLISFTPPRTLKQGKERVSKDIRKIVLGLQQIDTPPHKVVTGQDFVRVFVNKGVVYGVTGQNYQPQAGDDVIARLHQSKRNKRGRVPGKDETKAVDQGGWSLLNMLAVKEQTLDSYIRKVQGRVGRARDGWAEGTIQLGGRVAQWVSKHRNTGTFEDGTHGSIGNVFVQFDNKSEWASGGDDDRIIANAIKSRTAAIRKSIVDAAHGAGGAFKT